MDDSLRAMSVSELAERCERELDKFRRGETSSDRYILELCSRALQQRDALAWEVVQRFFDAMMHRWMRDHPLRDLACRYDSEENFVAQAFSRFWLATVDRVIAFQAIGAVHKFLRATLHSVIIDTLRTFARARMTALPETDDVDELSIEDYYETGELWEAIYNLVPGRRERRVFYLLYHCGLKPREIVRFLPNEFDDVGEIHRIRHNVMDRLRRNMDTIRWRIA
jgi:DNA-directed RNA polymerase specialized sigma24 family protein